MLCAGVAVWEQEDAVTFDNLQKREWTMAEITLVIPVNEIK